MTKDAFAVVQCLFNTIWRLFTSFEVPGTHFTPASWAFFCLFFVLFFRFLGKMLGNSTIQIKEGRSFAPKRVDGTSNTSYGTASYSGITKYK